MSVLSPSAILGPEMAAQILWAAGILGSAGKPNNAHNIPRFTKLETLCESGRCIDALKKREGGFSRREGGS